MSLVTNLDDAFTRVATESKSLRTLINNNALDLSALTTTAKSNLVAAINELDAAIDGLGSGGVDTLDELTDVVITAAAVGDILRHNGTNWVDALGTDFYATAAQGTTADNAVPKSLYDANSILIATTDNTPTALSIGASRIVGRKATGDIVALTGAEAAVIAGLVIGTDVQAYSAVLAATTAAFTTADETKLDAIEAGADVTDAGNVGSSIHGASNKATPVGADKIAIIDTEAANVLKTATLTALANFVTALIVDGSPGTLDTLNELAAALGDDPNFASTIATSLSGKQPLDATLTSLAATGTAANKGIYYTGTDTAAEFDLSAGGRALANAAGTANTFPYFSAANTVTLASISANARSFLAAADYAAMRTALDVYSKTEIGDPATDFVAIFEAGLV